MRFAVLVNEEEQYGLSPAQSSAPDGWEPAGFEGAEADCVAYVDEHWHDIRPHSLRVLEDG
jgi:MbtH protein